MGGSRFEVECNCRHLEIDGVAYYCLECSTLILIEWNRKFRPEEIAIGERPARLLANASCSDLATAALELAELQQSAHLPLAFPGKP